MGETWDMGLGWGWTGLDGMGMGWDGILRIWVWVASIIVEKGLSFNSMICFFGHTFPFLEEIKDLHSQ